MEDLVDNPSWLVKILADDTRAEGYEVSIGLCIT